MKGHATNWDIAGAIALLTWLVLMWAAVGYLWYAGRRTPRLWLYRAAGALVLVGVLAQLGHLQEHVAQLGYWAAHPDKPGWMTPWGTGLAMGFGKIDTARPALGMELLHLVGNFMFLAGLVGAMLITRRARATKTFKWARMGTWMQAAHGVEHLALTLSVAFGAKRAIGVSTLFGQLQPGPGLWTYRVWWHFIANVLGTAVFSMVVYCLWRERAVIEASHRPERVRTGPRIPRRFAPEFAHRWALDLEASDGRRGATAR